MGGAEVEQRKAALLDTAPQGLSRSSLGQAFEAGSMAGRLTVSELVVFVFIAVAITGTMATRRHRVRLSAAL
jgi:hypothetical protein